MNKIYFCNPLELIMIFSNLTHPYGDCAPRAVIIVQRSFQRLISLPVTDLFTPIFRNVNDYDPGRRCTFFRAESPSRNPRSSKNAFNDEFDTCGY